MRKPQPNLTTNAHGSFSVAAGRLAINFANALFADSDMEENQENYQALVDFFVASDVVQAAASPALLSLWESAPNESAELVRKAMALRDALRVVFGARVSRVAILPGDVAPINEVLSYAEGFDQLEPLHEAGVGSQDWRLALHSRSQGLEWLLTAIARSGAELIAEGPTAPIRKCANPTCGLFLYDDSRTGKRRWCSMALCGNRAKVAAHYRREKNK
jgi:predicted RNA-binding Zn ribbon-like protein